MGVPPAERDDVVQDVFVQVYRYLDRFEHRADVKTWLYKICLSQARRARRRGAVRAAFGWLVGAHPEQAEPSIDGERSEAEARQAVEEALGRMSERQRLVFVLYEMHGLSGQAIAEIAGCPPATVRGRLREARLIFTAAFEGGERGVR
jgi:RNA polymerase sigma-70 factor (ECF subfamily)